MGLESKFKIFSSPHPHRPTQASKIIENARQNRDLKDILKFAQHVCSNPNSDFTSLRPHFRFSAEPYGHFATCTLLTPPLRPTKASHPLVCAMPARVRPRLAQGSTSYCSPQPPLAGLIYCWAHVIFVSTRSNSKRLMAGLKSARAFLEAGIILI